MYAMCSPSKNWYYYCLVSKLCPTLHDPMDRSMPGFPILHFLSEFAQIHVCRVGDVI